MIARRSLEQEIQSGDTGNIVMKKDEGVLFYEAFLLMRAESSLKCARLSRQQSRLLRCIMEKRLVT